MYGILISRLCALESQNERGCILGRLAEYLGVQSLTPGQRLDLAPSQIKDLLECGKDKGLENALYAFADAFTGEYQVMLLIG